MKRRQRRPTLHGWQWYGLIWRFRKRSCKPESNGQESWKHEKVTSSDNKLSISFDELQDAFSDLHKESVKLAKLVSSSKKIISDLEKEVLKLNKEL